MADNLEQEPIDFNGIASPQTQKGRTDYDATWNPQKYTANINNPLARGLIQAYSGYKGAQGLNPLAGGYADIGAILGGAVGGLQATQQMQQQDMMMAPIEQVSPGIAEAIPAAKGIPFGQFMQLKDFFIKMVPAQKPDNTITELDLPGIKSSLKSKGYTDTEIDTYLPTLVGQPRSILAQMLVQTRAEKPQVKSWDVKTNEFGIPTMVQGIGNDNKPFKDIFIENQNVSKDLSTVIMGKKMIDSLNDKFNALLPTEKQDLAKALYENGFGGNLNIVGDEAGFIQRLRGFTTKALSRQAFAGDKGERLKALMDAIEANIPRIARSLGHTGVLTELDVLKSFGIAPDPKGTIIENVERRRIYDDLIRINVDSLLDRTVDVYGTSVDRNKVYKKFGLYDSQKPSGAKLDIKSASVADIIKAAEGK